MTKEDADSTKLKEERLKNRKEGSKKRPREENGVKDKVKAKKAKLEPRTLNGQAISEDQPILLEGGVMRSYQIEGYKWMSTLFENGINGILADEMGLGKTIQTIALFCHLVEMGIAGPFLIVAPLSTLQNWKKEFNRFAPQLPVVVYHGSKEERDAIRRKELKRTFNVDSLADGRKVRNTFITSYNIAMNDTTHFQRIKWLYVVVDEGHRLKDMNCRLIRELKRYDASNKLLLTGTPLQNNLDELWSLLNFIMGEIFDDLRVFRSWFSANEMHESGSEQERIIQQERQGNILNTLHQILTPFLLRRVKADVDLDIPPKKEILVYCPMTEHQRTFYEATVGKTMKDLMKSKENEGRMDEVNADLGRGKRKKMEVNYRLLLDDNESESDKSFDKYLDNLTKYQEFLSTRSGGSGVTAYGSSRASRTSEINYCLKNRIMDLRKTTNHPYLIEFPLTEDGVYYKVDENLVDISGKLKVLDQMLNELIKGGHKTLLFSQMTKVLDILSDYLNLRNIKYSRLDGTMSFEDRQENIDKFSESKDVNVFLLSTRAGGLGINLTAADTVIIYDSDWNPQQDLQAQDRAHRIGQTKPVMIYRLVTANTIDQRIVERAAAKRKLEKMVIHRGKFKSQDLSGLKKTMESISPMELIELLNSKDHVGVVDKKDGKILSKNDLNRLLDRSDMAWGVEPLKERSVNTADSPVKKQGSKSDFFKVIDVDDGKSGLTSIKDGK